VQDATLEKVLEKLQTLKSESDALTGETRQLQAALAECIDTVDALLLRFDHIDRLPSEVSASIGRAFLLAEGLPG